MTNNTAAKQSDPNKLTAVIVHDYIAELNAMKRDDLRKYASQRGIKGASKMTRERLTGALVDLHISSLPREEKNDVEEKTVRVRTSHADCDHASTKVARARCRRERAKNDN